MEKSFSRETASALRKLGLYQIIGGTVGALIIFWSMLKTPVLTGLTVSVYFFILLFFVYSIFCGTLCLKTRHNALRHSLANQILQIVGFAVMGFAFKYAAGFYITLGIDLTDSFRIDFGAGISKFDFSFNKDSERLEIDFNLIAFALVFWIHKLIKRTKQEAEIRETAAIGDSPISSEIMPETGA